MSQYELFMKSGPAPGKVFDLSKNELFIGRDVSNDIVINDTEISRRHCHLVLTGEGYAIEDLGSTNGTFINEANLSGQRLLRPGESIRLGDNVVLRYQPAGGDADATIASGDKPVAAVPPPPVARQPVQQPVYAGQVPAGPPAQAGKKRNLTTLYILAGVLVVGLCVATAVLWYIDANYLWCDVFGGLIPACR